MLNRRERYEGFDRYQLNIDAVSSYYEVDAHFTCVVREKYDITTNRTLILNLDLEMKRGGKGLFIFYSPTHASLSHSRRFR